MVALEIVQRRHADRDRHRQHLPVRHHEGLVGHAGADALGHHAGAFEVGVDQQHHEFLAAEAAQRVRHAQLGLDARRDFAQHVVAGLVAMAVVDLLEMVDVDVHARDLVSLAARAPDLLHQAPVHVAPVVDAGERIGQADVLQHFVADHVFQADRDDRAHMLDEIGAQDRREAARIAAAEIQAAEQALVAQQRHQRDAGQAARRLRKRHVVQRRVVQPQHRLGRRVGSEVVAQRLLVFAEQQIRQRLEIHAQLEHHRIDVGPAVDQRQGHAVEAGDDRQLAEDGLDQLLEAACAHQFEVEGLVPHHDGVVALGLVDQAGELAAQSLVLGD
jgi:hypothetical protein